jgi:hypothetical protein
MRESLRVEQHMMATHKSQNDKILFNPGQIVATPGAAEALLRRENSAGDAGAYLILRHITGDWGDLDAMDWASNDRDVVEGGRLLSAYTLADGTRLWIITEWDRCATTLLLPEEY